jgi:hypothetical protein
MLTIFMVNEDIACGMVCFFHQKKHSYLIIKQPTPGANFTSFEFLTYYNASVVHSRLERFYTGEK